MEFLLGMAAGAFWTLAAILGVVGFFWLIWMIDHLAFLVWFHFFRRQ